MNVAVATKIPKYWKVPKKSSSGPRSIANRRHCAYWRARSDCTSRTGQDSREAFGFEHLQVIFAFADANEVNGKAEARGERNQDAALGGSVELGHHESCQRNGGREGLDLGEGILSGGGVEHEENRVRRGVVELPDHSHDLLELCHEPSLVLEAARCVDQDDIGLLRAGTLERLEGETCGIRSSRPRDDLCTYA